MQKIVHTLHEYGHLPTIDEWVEILQTEENRAIKNSLLDSVGRNSIWFFGPKLGVLLTALNSIPNLKWLNDLHVLKHFKKKKSHEITWRRLILPTSLLVKPALPPRAGEYAGIPIWLTKMREIRARQECARMRKEWARNTRSRGAWYGDRRVKWH
jgi:hypothetical protein